MTNLITSNTGSFPRIGEGYNGQKLRRALSSIDRDEISYEQLLGVQAEIIREVILLQDELALDLLTDGQISWHDSVSYIMGKLPEVDEGPLTRFFDTNTYYRQPIIREKIRKHKPILVEDFISAQRITTKAVKPVLTGPFTLARLSVNNAYSSEVRLMEAMGHLIAQEVAALVRSGASVIQIDEPAILQNPQNMSLFRDLLEEIADSKGDARLALYTYFGDAAPVYNQLQRFKVDILGLDFTYSPGLQETIISSGTEKELGLGIIDGRNTKMETEEEVFPFLEAFSSLSRVDTCYLNPSCGLEYLPRVKAVNKLKNMVRLRDKFTGAGA
jgi:5-methyltetrahydropteroyltriglutamate--homocysteine methyltransferase